MYIRGTQVCQLTQPAVATAVAETDRSPTGLGAGAAGVGAGKDRAGQTAGDDW